MAFHPLPILSFLLLGLVASQAALPSEIYWNSVLPNTRMPKAVKDVLRTELTMDNNANAVPWVQLLYSYNHAWNGEDYPNYDPTATTFFLEKDLVSGTRMNLDLTKSGNKAPFFPRQIVDSIPFSSSKFPEILNHFSLKSDSSEAKWMKETLIKCEAKPEAKEDSFCATSLESMIDFSTSKIGKNVQVLSMELHKGTQMHKCTIMPGVRPMVGDKSVMCHKLNYAYAVFYCHDTENVSAYLVPVLTADGSVVTAIAMCHKDTSEWHPKHLAFQVLKVKPGTVPVCHFLSEDNVAWFGK